MAERRLNQALHPSAVLCCSQKSAVPALGILRSLTQGHRGWEAGHCTEAPQEIGGAGLSSISSESADSVKR